MGHFFGFFCKDYFLNGTSEILIHPFLSAKHIILSPVRHYFVAQVSKNSNCLVPENVASGSVLRLEMRVLLTTFELTSAGFLKVCIYNFKNIFKEKNQKHRIAFRICQIITQSRDKIA